MKITIGGRSKQNYGSLGKTCAVQLAWGKTLSLPPTCTQLVLCEKGKFSLDGSFSKNAPYKQKIIFHLTSIGKMSRFFFLPWTVGRWYLIIILTRRTAFLGKTECPENPGAFTLSYLEPIGYRFALGRRCYHIFGC